MASFTAGSWEKDTMLGAARKIFGPSYFVMNIYFFPKRFFLIENICDQHCFKFIYFENATKFGSLFRIYELYWNCCQHLSSWQYPLINYFIEASENEKCSKTGAVCTTPEISKFVFTHKPKEGGQNDPERLNYNDKFGNMGCRVIKGRDTKLGRFLVLCE